MVFIVIGVVIDLFAVTLRIGDTFGLTKPKSPIAQGLPIGPIFYLLGFVILLLAKKPFLFCVVVLLCCLLFYVFIIFLPSIIGMLIWFFRRIRASTVEIFCDNIAGESSSKDIVEHALKYIIENSRFQDCKACFIYLYSTNHKSTGAQVRVFPSMQSFVYVAECDPGHIVRGYFAKDMSSYGFPIKDWKVGKRKEIIVPPEDFNKISQFVDVLFEKYYNCGKDYRIKAEVMLI